MVSVSIQTMLFLLCLWKTSLGQPADVNDLLVSETSIQPCEENDSRQNFRISFQLKRVPTDEDDGFKNREVKFAILDKIKQQRLDEKSIVFDGSAMKMVNYNGKYFGVTGWMKLENKTIMTGYFDKNANETVFLVEEMDKSKQKRQLLHRRIIFDDKIKLNVFMKTARGKKAEEVNAGSFVTVFCKAHSTRDVKPKFEGLQFLNQTIKTNQKNKEIQATFRLEKGNHLKEILCVAGEVNQSLTIKVLHAPAAVRIKPAERDTLMAGGHLRCSAVDGYPPPTVTWLTTFVPPNGDKFHRIDQTTNSSSTFILKDNAPIGSVWTIRCRSRNRVGNFSLTVNFTVEENMQKVLVQRMSNLERKMEEKMTKIEKMMETMVQQHSALTRELKTSWEDATMLRKVVDGKAEELAKTKKEIGELSSKSESDKSEWRKADGDLRQLRKELRQMMNASRRMQEDAVGRLDKLAAAVQVDWFVWRIEEISSKVYGSYETSGPFYSDGSTGYKMCLGYSMRYNQGGLVLVFYLMRGDDDRLQWPMSRTVLIEIIDEQSRLPVMSHLVSRTTAAERPNSEHRKVAYDRPTSDRNVYGDGFVGFSSYEKIKWTAGAIHNDAMTVRCRVLPQ